MIDTNLFVCSSAYQLLNAICIACTSEMDSDLIIIRESLVASCNMDELKNSGIFSNIYIWSELQEYMTNEKVQDFRDAIFYNLRRLKCMISVQKIWKYIPNRLKKYNYIFLGYSDFISQCIYFWFKKAGSKLALFDEGTFTYGCLLAKEPILKKIGNKLLYRSNLFENLEIVYVRQPAKMQLGKYSNIEIKKIDSNLDNELNSKILKIYCANEKMTKLLNKPIIVFDQNMETKEARQMQKNIVDACCENINCEDVVIKIHPASRNNNYSEKYGQYTDKVPFEVLMNTYSMERKILISVFSSACFSPKLLMDQEPYVILTYKIMRPYFKFDESFLNIIDKVKSDYREKNKIFIPESMDELKMLVRDLYNDATA